MDPYQKSYDIRWGDLDPNRHVANTTYMALLNQTRMDIMADLGFTQAFLEKHQIGPVIFKEDFHYVREVHPNSRLRINIRMAGASQDWGIMRLAQRIFLPNGKLGVYSEVLFAWIDLNSRKLRIPPEELLKAYQAYPRTENFAVIDPRDTRASHVPYGDKIGEIS